MKEVLFKHVYDLTAMIEKANREFQTNLTSTTKSKSWLCKKTK